MVQKNPRTPSGSQDPAAPAAAAPRKRGRPRGFVPDVALERALAAFRDGGYAATSLDDLSAAMGINRPSLYAAFGGKRDLFLKAYARYRRQIRERFAHAFTPELTLRQSLERVLGTAREVYGQGANGPQGCFSVMTAGSEAMADPEIRDIVQQAFTNTDWAITAVFERAVARGELPADSDIPLLVQIVGSAIQTLAIRSRARFPPAELEALCARTVDLACSGLLRGKAAP